MARLRRSLRLGFRRFMRAILRSRDAPRAVALGVAVGVFVACTPTIGFQMIIAGAIATIVGASRLPAVVVVYISNPITALPLYGFCYKVGAYVLGTFRVHAAGWEKLRSLFTFPETGSLLAAAWQKFHGLLRLGSEVTLPLWTGCFLVGAISGLITYPVVLRLVEGHRLLQAQKRAKRRSRRIESGQEEPPKPEGPGESGGSIE